MIRDHLAVKSYPVKNGIEFGKDATALFMRFRIGRWLSLSSRLVTAAMFTRAANKPLQQTLRFEVIGLWKVVDARRS
jgi:hypothetical protein